MKHTILCVDDEIDNVEALERLLRKKYRILKAISGHEALQILDQEKSISLIISDQRMPEMTGVEFLEKSIATHPDTIRILLTGYTDIDSVISAINSGQVYRYVTKPWDPIDLTTAVDRGIEKYEMSGELKEKNEELKKALDELSTLDKAKDQFMILINHELKTPLTSILSFTELLKETSLSEEQGKFLNRIHVSAERLKEIIDDVLKLVSAESGHLSINPTLLNPSTLFIELPIKIKSSLEAKKQKVSFNFLPDQIYVDQSILSSVILRLIHNGSKFGFEETEIKCISQKISEREYQFSIENKGPEISTATIEKIMKPFVLNEDIMKHSTGMGLGLSLSQALLKSIHSKLVFEYSNETVRVSFVINPKIIQTLA